MIVYHGSDVIIEKPDINHSFRPLDFGKGFYVTANLEQATRWAKRKSDINNKSQCYVNVYDLSEFGTAYKVKRFSNDLRSSKRDKSLSRIRSDCIYQSTCN